MKSKSIRRRNKTSEIFPHSFESPLPSREEDNDKRNTRDMYDLESKFSQFLGESTNAGTSNIRYLSMYLSNYQFNYYVSYYQSIYPPSKKLTQSMAQGNALEFIQNTSHPTVHEQQIQSSQFDLQALGIYLYVYLYMSIYLSFIYLLPKGIDLDTDLIDRLRTNLHMDKTFTTASKAACVIKDRDHHPIITYRNNTTKVEVSIYLLI
jgi:hypothetical protein